MATLSSKLFYSGESKYQKVNVVNLGSFGKCLIIDGHVQSSESDEYIYHECLVQPVMNLHPNPKKVFIAGGGEGATAREILRHKSVERLVMVDIDDIVIRVSKEHLPHHHAGAFENSRMELVNDDAKAWLEQTNEKFDVIIMDLPDPIEEVPAFLLYTQKFYTMIKTKLNEDGLLITQSGPGGPTSMGECFAPIYKTLSTVFPAVSPYFFFVPAFGDCNGFNLASVNGLKALSVSPDEINKRIEERIIGGSSALKFYDGLTHQNLFSTPKSFRQRFEKETNIITEDNPSFCFQGCGK